MQLLTQRAHSRPEALPSAPPRPLDVLFVMPRLSYLRFFQSSLDLMIESGFNLRLLLESPRCEAPSEQEWLTQAETRPNFVCETIDHFKSDPLRDRRIALRLGMEYVRRLGSAYSNRVAGRARARLSRAPKAVQRLAKMPLIRTPRGLRMLYGVLSAFDRALPRPAAPAAYVEHMSPDVVAVCDKGQPGSLSSAYVKAAQERGIPTAVCVASWDNLTNRQRTRVVPHALFVWNERQRQEAVDFHGIPAERVAVTGAPRFDDWFSWKARDRTEFLGRVGLDPAKPVVLWAGCALNAAEVTEAEFVSKWIAALRSSSDPTLREAGVLVRPHPERFLDWVAADYSEFPNVALWPRDGMTFPIDLEAKADYYDSIFHSSAVVGINTSAMIEASIIGRPVLTVLVPEFHDSQLATFHFSYLLQSEGGPVQVAQTMEEHLADISAALDGRDSEASERARSFVADFVRPHGLERPATPIFVATLEQIAQARVDPERDPAWILPLRAVLAAVFGLLRLRRELHQKRRHVVKWTRGAFRTHVAARQRRLRRRLRKTIRRWWWAHGQPVLSRLLKQPDRVHLWRAGVLGLLREFRRGQPPGALRPDYSDLLFLYRLVRERRPTTLLEFGSGCSTAVLATALRDNHHGHLWSVEGDEQWARATEEALPEVLQPFVTVVHSLVLEDDRDVLGWSYERIPPIDPDFVYLDGPPHTPERKVAFDVLDIESRFRPGFVLVVDGRGRNAYYLRDHLTGTYRFVEYKMRWRHMFRFLFELVDSERRGALEEDLRASDASVGS